MEKFLLFSGVGRKKDQLENWDVDLKRQKPKDGLGEVLFLRKKEALLGKCLWCCQQERDSFGMLSSDASAVQRKWNGIPIFRQVVSKHCNHGHEYWTRTPLKEK